MMNKQLQRVYLYLKNRHMIKLSDLIFEKFELPSVLEKQLETTAYSALGHILPSQFDKLKKSIFSNKELNEKSYNGLKNIFDYIRLITEKGGGNTTLVYTDVLVTEYFSVTDYTKEQIHKCKVTIEKVGDEIYVNSDEKKVKHFPNMVIHKDYAGWDLKNFNENWNVFDGSFKQFKKEFDEKLLTIETILNKLQTWRGLDKARKPKFQPHGEKTMFVYEKTTAEGIKYEHYFRASPNRKSDTTEYSDYFSSVGGKDSNPIIVQTVYYDEFDTKEAYSVEKFMKSVESFTETSKHEGRHLIQHIGNVQKKLKGDFYGGPKKTLRHQYNTDVRGVNPSGVAKPNSKYKDEKDTGKRVSHVHRDVEFKTNLYDYKVQLEDILSKNFPKTEWKEGFRDLLSYTVGKLHYIPFNKKFRFSGTMWPYTTAFKHLKQLYDQDKPKFNQMVKELYKLIFNG